MVNSIGSGGRSRGADRGGAPRGAAPAPRDGPRADGQKIFAQVKDQATGRPLGGARYEVVDAGGAVVAQGTTDWQGMVRHDVQQPGSYTVRVLSVPPPEPAAAGPTPAAPAPAAPANPAEPAPPAAPGA